MLPVNVLVVEDEKITRRKVGGMLEGMGYQTQLFESAEQGLKAFDKYRFDVVLTDVELPGMDGIEMVRRLRSIDPLLAPVIMTARHDQEIAVRAIECGVKSFLSKPFTQDQLEDSLEEVIKERTQTVEMRLLLADLVHKRHDLQDKVVEQGHKLTSTESFLQHLVDAAPFAILSTDMEDEILTFNGRAEEIYGFAAAEMIGKHLSTLFGSIPDSPAPTRQDHLCNGGEVCSVLVHPREVYNYDEKCIARLYVVEDLREREKLEEQLFYAERLSLLGQLAPQIAHEFKTPLQIIIGYAELALEDLKRNGKDCTDSHWLQIMPAARQMLDLVHQMENVGKPTESQTRDLDLVEDVEKLLSVLQNLGAVKSCQIVKEFAPSLPRIRGDSVQIEQIFRDLIVNAAQAMEESKQSFLGLSLQPSADGHRVEATVSDTGAGIPAKNIEEIFQPFFTTKEQGKGTGLGLSIVKTALDRHRATIRVESAVGEGTHFHLSFPVAGEEGL